MKFIYFEKERKAAGERQRERERERERDPSRLSPVTTETDTGFKPMNLEIMT